MTTTPVCAAHPDRPAPTVCRRCGNFTCVECNPDGQTECPKCKALPGASQFTRGPVIWERREELGVAKAFYLHTKETITEPKRFWLTMDPNGKPSEAFWYGWAVATFMAIGSAPYNAFNFWLQSKQMDEMFRTMGSNGTKLGGFKEFMELFGWFGHHPVQAAAVMMVFGIVFFPVGLVMQSAVVHLGATVVGLRKYDFSATMRAVAYSQAPNVLMVIPVVGQFAGLYTLVQQVWGVRDTHEGTTGKAIIATMWPVVLMVCCGCAGIIAAIALAAGA